MKKLAFVFLISSVAALAGCIPSGGGIGGGASSATGSFSVVSVNILEGETWALNRPIQIKFNHAVDFSSVSMQAVSFRSTDLLGSPVTGQFEIDPTDDTILIFNPACPTNAAQDNGAFVPGAIHYVIEIPIATESVSVLRDTDGRLLSFGLQRGFITPPASQPFQDLVPGAPIVVDPESDISFPAGVNFWANSEGSISVRFNQSIDARSTNLNTDRLLVLYSNAEIGEIGEEDYDSTNKVPGEWVLIENCSNDGSLVEFHITGVMPINRNIAIKMTPSFTDIVGQSNSTTTTLATHQVPRLSDVYGEDSGAWLDANETVDEFTDSFDDQNFLDLDQQLPLPLATVSDGFVAASFDYPGTYVSEDQNFHIDDTAPRDIYTDSATSFADSDNKVHTPQSGVLNVHDFTIDAGATLRGRGLNPLVIYATGTVTINGEINVSGNNAVWPSGLNSPQFIEGGALGECGGGQGGDASQIGLAETPRAEPGDGPFGVEGIGGQGGEGIFNGRTSSTGLAGQTARSAAGGGGGGFALTENQSVLWPSWKTAGNWAPSYFTYAGPDHKISRHTMAVGVNGIFGSEAGIRGVSAGSLLPGGWGVGIPFGMEDAMQDSLVTEAINSTNAPDYDPAWTTGATPPFNFGHPTQGADPGAGGQTIFANDNDLTNDFYGTRLMIDGAVRQGELLVPWAGSGGGGSGDSMMINVWDADGDGDPNNDAVESFYPLVPFSRNQGSSGNGWYNYQKGAGGGGGGGQLIIMSIGMIVIGNNAEIKANGGIGYSGESLIYTNQGVSGSGGGSGGHIVLHSSAGVDLSAVSIGSASNSGQIGNLTDNGVVQAFGGRRGQCGGAWSQPSIAAGTGTYAFGRGGAGANGVIQIHVPNPKEDIIWHPSAATGIAAYLDEVAIPTDRIEEILAHVSFPQSYALVPFYSASSMVASEWIDTGLAELRLQDPDSYPDWANVNADPELIGFDGIDPDGKVKRQGNQQRVGQLSPIANGLVADAEIDLYEMTIYDASTVFENNTQFLRLPALLLGYDIYPNLASSGAFEIVDVVYDNVSDEMTFSTPNSDGGMLFVVDPNGSWSIVPKFFRVDANGVKNKLPSSSEIYFEFQGADEIAPGLNIPGTPLLGDNVWTPNLRLLAGARFLRYRIRFDADSQNSGIDLSTPLTVISYIKIPYAF
jgi:hypothetical protein